jgi:Ni,Fe-hydrogenase I large subunit
MGTKITVDPVTRIEGHLKIDVEIEDGKVKDAWSSGTMARGMEILLKGKDPRDASYVTSRICGVCHSVHQLCSVYALDDAFGANVPTGGTLLRNLAMGAQYIYDHPLHFYHLCALDYLDIMAIANYTGKDEKLNAVKDKVVGLVKTKDTYPLTPRYKPDEYCVNDPETVTSAVKHYIDALSMQANARNMGAVFGGRQPHYQSIVVGGFTQLPDVNQVVRFQTMLNEQAKFINEVYIPDVLAFGTGPLFPLAKIGLGGGHYNYISCGALEKKPPEKELLFPAGVIMKLDLANIQVQPFDADKITEAVTYSWYKDGKPLRPANGVTEYDLEKKKAYSFVKAPRYDGQSMEVGPLARQLVAKNPDLLGLVEKGAKPGVVARHAARALETKAVVDACYKWCDQLLTKMTKPGFKIHDTEHWEPPQEGSGAGFYEPPRGTLGHWIKIKDAKIENYQCVVPSTWNASPRCNKKIRGQYEESLIGAPVPDPDNPINVVRIVRSFDPCLACAIHLIHPKTNEIKKFIVA